MAPEPRLCEKCGKIMRLIARVPPVARGGEKGTVFHCEPCGVIKWIDHAA